MGHNWQEFYCQKSQILGLLLFLITYYLLKAVKCQDVENGHYVADSHNGEDKKFGDKCTINDECSFIGSVCDVSSGKCLCRLDLPVTNHLDKCGHAAKVNESCFFSEQCEFVTPMTECKDGVCICRFEKQPVIKTDGSIECVVLQNYVEPGTYVDPAMIGILVSMFLMFVTICVVLRLFSRARWRENRTIFNTPNPRLMNASLLRENKLHDRRGSRGTRTPSRAPSMASLHSHSPNSRPGSPHHSKHTTGDTILENVTVEVQEGK